jgi:carboxypeptidase C (cathepsin A)
MLPLLRRLAVLLLCVATVPGAAPAQIAPVPAVPTPAAQDPAAPSPVARSPAHRNPASPDPASPDLAAGATAANLETRSAPARDRLPPTRITHHALALPGRTLGFRATAGAVTITGADNREEADLAFVAYTLDGADPATRPVTFLVNGGPGAASAYLHIGVVGPWILPLDGERIVPSGPAALVPNPDTWLDFTDLVFIDPVGTGFSRFVGGEDQLRKRYLSVGGDAAVLADAIARWLMANDRTGSPKYFAGESYGGFRGPLVAQHLRDDQGLALSGLNLVSPVLDFGWWQQPDYAPLPMVAVLPSLAAARMEAEGRFSQPELEAVEDYAAGDFLIDLLRGVNDDAAVARITERIAALTGLDPDAVARRDGRIDAGEFSRESRRDERLRTSIYDATVTASGRSRGSDPVLDAMTAPLTTAMLGLYRDTLEWLPNRSYQLLNSDISRGWDWGSRRGQPEAVTDLADLLSLDPDVRVLITHGRTDLVTPYFGTALILRQLAVSDSANRLVQRTYAGGHMFYTRPESRRAFRAATLALYADRSG